MMERERRMIQTHGGRPQVEVFVKRAAADSTAA
jgi:hypothetical protein